MAVNLTYASTRPLSLVWFDFSHGAVRRESNVKQNKWPKKIIMQFQHLLNWVQ